MKKISGIVFGLVALVGCATSQPKVRPAPLSNTGTAHAEAVPATEVKSSEIGMQPNSVEVHNTTPEPEVHYGCH